MNATPMTLRPVAETEPGYGQLFSILLRRRWWVLAILLSAIGAGAFYGDPFVGLTDAENVEEHSCSRVLLLVAAGGAELVNQSLLS